VVVFDILICCDSSFSFYRFFVLYMFHLFFA